MDALIDAPSVLARRVLAFGPADDLEVAILLRGRGEERIEKGAILVARFADREVVAIAPPYAGWWHTRAGEPFVYVPVEPSEGGARWTWPVPVADGAASAELAVLPWLSEGDTAIETFEIGLAERPAIVVEGAASHEIAPQLRTAELEALIGSAIGHSWIALTQDAPLILEIELSGLGVGHERGAGLFVGYFNSAGLPLAAATPSRVQARNGFDFHYLSTAGPRTGAHGAGRRLFLIAPPRDAVTALVLIERWRDRSAYSVTSTTSHPADGAALARLLSRLAAQPRFGEQKPFGLEVLRYLRRAGRIADELDCLRLTAGSGLGAYAEERRPWLEGMLRELDTGWLPMTRSAGGATSPIGPANRVMMLAKVALPFDNSGGAVRNFNTARVTSEAGWEPYVVTPLGYPGCDRNGALPFTSNPGGIAHLHLNVADARLANIPIDRLMREETALLAGIYRRYGGRLIHAVSGIRGYDNALKALALRARFGVPVLYDLRSLHEHSWSAPGAHALDAELTRMRAVQEERCVREADHTVVISEAMKALLVARGAPQGRISVIPNGVDLTRFADIDPGEVRAVRAELAIDAEAQVHGCISNLSAREGHSVLLRAHAELVAAHPGLVCLIVGDGPSRAALEREADDLGIAGSVRFAGEIPHRRIHLYYRLFELFIVPRVPDYAADHVTPIKPFEAMAARRPVVMSDLPVTREILGRDGERGLVVAPDDPAALAAAIARLLADPALAAALGERGRAWVMRERGWDTVMGRFSEIYRELGAVSARPARTGLTAG